MLRMNRKLILKSMTCTGFLIITFYVLSSTKRQALTKSSVERHSDTTNWLKIKPAASSPVTLKTSKVQTNASTETVAEARFQRRRDRVQLVCERNNPGFRQLWINSSLSGKAHPNFIASLEKKALMCVILKAGSSSWHDLFWHFRKPIEAETQPFFEKAVFGNVHYYKDLSDTQRRNLSEDPDTIRIVNVRHPFSRLISGWNDKFAKMYFYQRWFEEFPLLKNYPSELGKWNGRGHFMSWKSFMQYVADHGLDSKNLDRHFQSITTCCNPCQYRFDYIVKAETFQSSFDFLVKNKLSHKSMQRQNVDEKHRTVDEAVKIVEKFSQLDRGTIEKLLDIYRLEMELFGYTFDVDTLTAGGWDD